VNNINRSLTSEIGNGATILTIPQAPLNLRNRAGITSATQIGLEWDLIPSIDQGGAAILYYSIFKAVGAGVYETLETGLTTTTYIAIDLSQGETYSFKVQSENIYGPSLDSLPTSILAAQVPDRPAAPTTSLSGTSLTVTWVAPDDRGKAIDEYTITILKSDLSTYSLELNDCDGSDPIIVGQTYCVIDVLVLRTGDFSLPWGTKVFAKVIAHNSYGYSQESAPGAGINGVLMTYPDAPTTLTEQTLSRAADSITFTWVDGQFNNGAVVTKYRVSMSDTDGLGTYSELVPLAFIKEYTASGLTAGHTYNFKVEAYNAFGYGGFSSAKSIKCATKPSKIVAPPTTSVSTRFVTIDWTTPNSNGLPITAYSIYIRKGD